MINNNTPFQLILDDGRVINDKLSNLTREEIISVANQYRHICRRCMEMADELMIYQHNKFSINSPRKA